MGRKLHVLLIAMVLLAGSACSLAAQEKVQLIHSNWKFRKKGDSVWMPATVPGTVHTDLLANQKIHHPYLGTNETFLQWIENEDWEYICDFFVSIEDVKSEGEAVLEFEGLDTYAEIWLNGEKLDSTNNMFRTWRYYVKSKLHSGNNQLAVVFSSAVKRGKAEAKKLPYTLPGDEKIFTRKAQYQYGWDWGPRFVTCGVWKPVKLRFLQPASVYDYAVSYSVTNKTVNGKINVELRTTTDERVRLVVRDQQSGKVYGTDSLRIAAEPLVSFNTAVQVNFKIPEARLWWCNGQGEAYQYPLQLDVYIDGKLTESKKFKMGFRTIELVQEKDTAGASFYFKLNGKPIFMKGANYIPPSNFLPSVKKYDYELLVADAAKANMNMLRVWGGGVYADDAFYNACDSLGIMVWQDFMFACAMYPGDDAFIENVMAEARQQVKRLENHACMALWCGNNEIDEGWKNWGWQKQYKYSATDSASIYDDYKNLFEVRLASIVKSRSNIAYWPSSPSIGWGHPESLKQGDAHYWGVWWGMQPFEIYREKTGRFMSEYGFQGMPPLRTIRSFVPPNETLSLESPSVKHHQKHPTGYQTIQTYMDMYYRKPKDFESYVYVSQLLQARGMRTAIDAHLQKAPYCMGTLYWQFNDCWPVTSWSGMDANRDKKALQYTVERLYHPNAVSMHHANDTLDVYAHCTGKDSTVRRLELSVYTLKGKLLYSHEIIVHDHLISQRVFRLPLKPFIEKYGANNLHFTVKSKQPNNIPVCSYQLVPPKDLALKKAELTFKVKSVEKRIAIGESISIQHDSYLYITCKKAVAKDVFFDYEYLYFPLQFSDNFFDMVPGETRILKIDDPYSFKHLDSGFRVRSLVDTY